MDSGLAAARRPGMTIAGADDMQALRLLFSPFGRLGPKVFIFNAIAVYAVGVAAQWLAIPDIQVNAGIWPFVIVQALLIWIWYALHAKRLHDADRSAGLAAGAALLYALSVVLLLIVATNFFQPYVGGPSDSSATAVLNVTVFIAVLLELMRMSVHELNTSVVGIFIVMAFSPMIVALALTVWAASRPSVPRQ
jgi:uncharacterized membrane protein YhaH (DUF805 family)